MKHVLLLFVLFSSISANAHNRSRGQTMFDVLDPLAGSSTQKVRTDITLSTDDILDLLYIDLTKPNEQEALSKGLLQKTLSKNVRRFVKLSARKDEAKQFSPCALTFDNLIKSKKRNTFTVRTVSECDAPIDHLRIDWGLSSATKLDLVHVGKVRRASLSNTDDDALHTLVLSKIQNAHEIVLREPSLFESAKDFFILGAEHIALGYDHLMFLLALMLACKTRRRLLGVVSLFTLSHSITIALSALSIVRLSPDIVEPLIALSIAIGALLSLAERHTKRAVKTMVLTFAFGLVHGLGFATILHESLSQTRHVFVPLLSFNIGIEVCQVLLVSAAFLVLSPFFKRVTIAPKAIALVLTLVGLALFIQRVFF